MKKIIPVLLILLFTFLSCGSGSLDEGVVARVNKTDILQEAFDSELDAFKRQYEAQGQFLTDADLDMVKPQLLDTLIVKQLLQDKAEELELKADTDAALQQIEGFKAQFPTLEDFEKSLVDNGFTEEALIAELEWQSLVQALFDQEVAPDAKASEEDVRQFYDDNQASYFMIPESVNVSHILIMVNDDQSEEAALAKIKSVQAEIQNGMDFGDAASTYSEGPTKDQRGELGAISRGQTVPPFEEAAFSQEIGVVGEPVLSQFGYHLILVSGKTEESVTPFDDVKDIIQQQLDQQAYEAGSMAYIEAIREEAEIVMPEWAQKSAEDAVQAPVQS